LLTIKRKWLKESSCRLSRVSVGLSVTPSEKDTVAKRLIGSERRLGS